MRIAWALPVVALVFGSSCAGTWSQRGPALGGVGMNGRLTAIVASQTTPNTLIVGSPGGGIWKSTDGGASWMRPLGYALADYDILHLAWDRTNASRLFAVTPSDLYASTDLGEHWSNLTHNGGVPAPLRPLLIANDPIGFAQVPIGSNNAIVWARPCDGLWWSGDDGSTFNHYMPFPGGASNLDNCVHTVAIDESVNTLYIGTLNQNAADPAHLFSGSLIQLMVTGSTSFTPASGMPTLGTLPVNRIVDAIAWTGAAGGVVAATWGGGGVETINQTTNGGISWGPGVSTGVLGPVRPLLHTSGNELLMGGVVMAESPDLGATWSMPVLGGTFPQHSDMRAIYAYNYGPGQSYVWVTTDGSLTNDHASIIRWNWTAGSPLSGGVAVSHGGIPSWTVLSTTPVPRNGAVRLFAGALDNGAACSDDRGLTWTTSGAPRGADISGPSCGDLYSIVYAPSNPDRGYARSCNYLSFERTDNARTPASCGGVSWTPIPIAAATGSPGLILPFSSSAMIAVHPTNADRVVFLNSYNALTSTNGGALVHQTTNFPSSAQACSVAIDGAGTILVGTLDHGVYASSDDGMTWNPFALNSGSPKAVLRIASSGSTYYLATTTGLFRRRPSDTAWQNVTPEVVVSPDAAYAISDVAIDPHCASRLYAAHGWIEEMGEQRGGVLASSDGGDHWVSITSGLAIHQGPVTSIAVDPVDSRYVYAGTWGQGTWVYDRGPTTTCP